MLELFKTDWKAIWGNAVPSTGIGVVYTRPDIVQLILDLAGFTVDSGRLAAKRTLEPSCGSGAFVTEIVHRLIESEKLFQSSLNWNDSNLDEALRATDIDLQALKNARETIIYILQRAGCPSIRASRLAETWTMHTDFLLHDWDITFDFVLGNPPYARIEDIPKQVLSRYREGFSTTTDRADLYVPFIEQGLRLLSEEGVLGFICANRFAKNRYGARLRELISGAYHVRWYVNLEHTQPFEQTVSAYPAIFILDHDRGTPTHAATLTDLHDTTLNALKNPKVHNGAKLVSVFPTWYRNGAPWTSTSQEHFAVLEELKIRYPKLEESAPGTTIGIGVATGADKVFVLHEKRSDIEASRQLPLLLSSHIGVDKLNWDGTHLLNPFSDADDGSLATLKKYPGLESYLEKNESVLKERHVARTRPLVWYRTIDRIWPELVGKPKLVIPDIQPGGVIGYDSGEFYPHHNVYWITSESWDLRALQTILRSTFVRVQMEAYSVQMRGGSLRYQAATLRQIRIPLFTSLSADLIQRLNSLSTNKDLGTIDKLMNEIIRPL